MKTITCNEKEYTVISLLGKGKGGYSYLVTDGQQQYVLKQIHHEPCNYYTFGDKLASEIRDYETLRRIGIPVPRMLEYDSRQERILKEYIEGDTIAHKVQHDQMQPHYYAQIQAMCQKLYAAGINIDYYPTNFVVQNEQLYYIDFECNPHMEKWDYEHWGSLYWYKTDAFVDAFCK